MNIKNLILLTFFFLIGSQIVSSQSKKGNLPVLDISKRYPETKICLQDIAESEYIPLETSDDILLGDRLVLSYVSDKYILIHEPIRGHIFVFNRNGKLYSHFNHKGPSGWEYAWIGDAGTMLDEKNEEIFVCNQSIQVYSLTGEYKRTLKVNTILSYSKVFNFDDKSLLVYDDVVIEPGLESKTKKDPYRLVSKKDGSLISVLNIHFPKRYSTRFAKKLDKNRWCPVFTSYPESMYNGQNIMIADISSDTLYQLSPTKGLTPLLTREPSVHVSESRKWFVNFTTDKFICLGSLALDPEGGGKIPFLTYEFGTGKTSRMSFLDADFGMKQWIPGNSSAIAQNMAAELISASSIMDAYKKKQLKGNVEKFVKTLNEDDNPVVRIVKFK